MKFKIYECKHKFNLVFLHANELEKKRKYPKKESYLRTFT